MPIIYIHVEIIKLCYIGFIEESAVEELLQECARMAAFEHPHVMSLIGVCLDGGPVPYIVLPYMANGSLLTYLKKERHRLVIYSEDEEVYRCIYLRKCMRYRIAVQPENLVDN